MAFYTEQFETFQASGSAGVWEDKILSIFGVPANAVVEVALLNTSNADERSCGVRAVGSAIDNRRISINKDEALGLDTYTMHVQSDADSKIQIYAENLSDIFFRPLGYWTSGIYVETRDTFNASSPSVWEESDLSSFGVSGEKVCEIVITNNNATAERIGGVRSINSALGRLAQLHEAEGGGNDAVTMFVNSSKDSKIEINADNTTDISFTLMGYWDPPPGAYIEKFEDIGSPSLSSTWEDVDLSSFTIPASAVVEVLLGNQDTLENDQLGVRQTGSSLGRILDLRDAEAGGTDFGRMHVNVDPSNNIQFFHQDVTDPHVFRAIGYWTQEKFGSMSLFISGPVLSSGDTSLFIKAGESGSIPLFIEGLPFGETDLFIEGKPSGDMSLFLDATPEISGEMPLYVAGRPFGESDLYVGGKPSGEISQFIQGHVEFNAFAKVEDAITTNNAGLFIYGGASGTEFTSDSVSFSISGGVGQAQEWDAFAKVGGIPLTSGEVTWPAFARVDNTKSSSMGLFINAGPNIDDSMSLFIQDSGTSTSLTGAVPFSGSFSMFARVPSGVLQDVSLFMEGFIFPSGATDLFMSGSPTVATDSISLFMSGLFEEISSSMTLVIPLTLGSGNTQTSLFIPGGGC